MNKLLATLGVGALAVFFGFIPLAVKPAAVSGADDDALWKPFLAESDFNKIVEGEVKLIQDEMKNPKADAKKIRGSAIVIALAAQNKMEEAVAQFNEPVRLQGVLLKGKYLFVHDDAAMRRRSLHVRV